MCVKIEKKAKSVYSFIAFYGVMGTLSHSKIMLELFLQNDEPQAFFLRGQIPPSTPLFLRGRTPQPPPPNANRE